MQKTTKTWLLIFVLTASLAQGTVFAQEKSVTQDSLVTVDQLLKIDNANARDKARKDALAAGVLQPEMAIPTRKGEIAAATVSVQQITGVDGIYKIDLVYNGRPYQGVAIGSPVEGCVIEAVAGQCVTLRPKVSPKSKAKPPVGQCPTTCWTGIRAASPYAMASQLLPNDMPTSGRPMPFPSAPPLIGNVSGAMPSNFVAPPVVAKPTEIFKSN